MAEAPNDRGGIEQGPLHASLAELAGTSLEDLAPEPDDAPESGSGEIAAIPSFDLPTDRRVVTARGLAAEIAKARASVTHVTGAAGGAAGLVLRALAEKAGRPVIAVTADVDTARALAADASFL